MALAHDVHPHNRAAVQWGEALDPAARLYFCRFTQLSVLRLLTTPAAMGDDKVTMAEAWHIYDRFYLNGNILMAEEPKGLEASLRARTMKQESSHKVWADAYLTAFAELAGLRFVTFDKALAGKTRGAILLTADA